MAGQGDHPRRAAREVEPGRAPGRAARDEAPHMRVVRVAARGYATRRVVAVVGARRAAAAAHGIRGGGDDDTRRRDVCTLGGRAVGRLPPSL